MRTLGLITCLCLMRATAHASDAVEYIFSTAAADTAKALNYDSAESNLVVAVVGYPNDKAIVPGVSIPTIPSGVSTGGTAVLFFVLAPTNHYNKFLFAKHVCDDWWLWGDNPRPVEKLFQRDKLYSFAPRLLDAILRGDSEDNGVFLTTDRLLGALPYFVSLPEQKKYLESLEEQRDTLAARLEEYHNQRKLEEQKLIDQGIVSYKNSHNEKTKAYHHYRTKWADTKIHFLSMDYKIEEAKKRMAFLQKAEAGNAGGGQNDK